MTIFSVRHITSYHYKRPVHFGQAPADVPRPATASTKRF